ncbi:hypothetical protein PG991_006782 [Apiospora marii]|uniref:Uncharacterized protein n=1 Tax=Apiospora marii TaxID=335849 RepID=A0ABR1RYA1_9PEZI
MPWLVRTTTSSSMGSPRSSLGPFSPTRDQQSAMSISYILPLMDGATGSVPLTHEHSLWPLLRTDAMHCMRAVSQIFAAFATSLSRRRGQMSWKEHREIFLYLVLSLLELQFLLTAIPMWLLMPGFFVLPLLSIECSLIWSLIQIVNSEDRTFVCRWNGADEEKEEGWEHYTWAVVGGMEWSEEHLRKKTLPRLTELFNHDMHTFLPYRLGFPLDMLSRFLQRTLQVPTPTSTAVYNHVRANCVKLRSKQMNILVHNTGALDMAWVMSRLCADLPPGQQLGKFNVYTFGSAMPEMTLPLGSHNGHEGHNCNCEDFPEYPIVNHYAFEDDPFARFGVFLGVRQRMEGRVVGAVYGLQAQGSRRRRSKSWFSSGGRFTLDDYLDALFPDGNPRAGALGEVCKIERDISEMRELSALAKAVREVSRKGKRLSWTALGALAGSHSSASSHCRNDRNEMAGVVSLEEARRIGKSMEGILGYENNLLAAFVRGDYRLHLDEQKGFQAGCDECD